MTTGHELFCRYAQPPNELSYCGPDDTEPVAAVAAGLVLPSEEMTRIALAFRGAWPYLELIASATGRHPLAREVVEAYWIGSPLLGKVDDSVWGHSVSDRFRDRAGKRWDSVLEALYRGGSPNHAFHVFCVYPWVGMLAEGYVGPSLEVLDNCRISWGSVLAAGPSTAEVSRQSLIWQDETLILGEPVTERVTVPDHVGKLRGGDLVSMHWRTVCERIDPNGVDRLRRVGDRHLAIANAEMRARRLEPAPTASYETG